MPSKTKIYICISVAFNYEKKASLNKGYWNPKLKLGVASHLSKIINFQFGTKKSYTLFGVFTVFRIVVAQLSLKWIVIPNFRCIVLPLCTMKP